MKIKSRLCYSFVNSWITIYCACVDYGKTTSPVQNKVLIFNSIARMRQKINKAIMIHSPGVIL